MHRAALRWELSRLSRHGAMLALFAAGLVFALAVEAGGGEDAFLPAILLGGALGAVAAADAGAFSRAEEGMHDLAYILSRPTGRLPVFLFRLGIILLGGALVGTTAIAACRMSGPASAWTTNWALALCAFAFAALAQLGLLTEPKLPLRERLHRRTFVLKLLPPMILGVLLWVPYFTGAIDIYDRGGPTRWWMTHAPLATPTAILALGTGYLLGLIRDWNRTEITS